MDMEVIPLLHDGEWYTLDDYFMSNQSRMTLTAHAPSRVFNVGALCFCPSSTDHDQVPL